MHYVGSDIKKIAAKNYFELYIPGKNLGITFDQRAWTFTKRPSSWDARYSHTLVYRFTCHNTLQTKHNNAACRQKKLQQEIT